MNDTVVLVISSDLPFAMSRFCGAGLSDVITLSTFRNRAFHMTTVSTWRAARSRVDRAP